jgi:thiol-disulfide isomerase/thioredoxin
MPIFRGSAVWPAENSSVFSWPAVVLAALTATSGTSAPSTGLPTIRFNAAPPDFAIAPTPWGTQYLSDLRGKVVVIDFWATWCDICTAEMKYFVRAQQSYAGKVSVVTISDELPDVAASYFRVWEIGLPVVDDPLDAIHRIYSVDKIPVTLVLDREGNVSYVSVGGLDWRELQNAIDADLGPANQAPKPR